MKTFKCAKYLNITVEYSQLIKVYLELEKTSKRLEKKDIIADFFKKTPENGLAIFCGDASLSENKTDIKVWSIEPPEPLNFRVYRCDQTFVLEPLREMLEYKDVYGLIVLDRKEATLGFLKGPSIVSTVTMHSAVPGKTKAGGQCQVFGTLIQSVSGSILKIEKKQVSMYKE